MIDILTISHAADDLIEKYKTNSPQVICDRLGVITLFKNLGQNEDAIKAFSTCFFDKFCIVVNENLNEIYTKQILAHELGHIILHSDKLKGESLILDTDYLGLNSVFEKEANYFASELLISDNDVTDHIIDGLPLNQIAASLCISNEFLILKCDIMRKKGYNILNFDNPDPKFLAHIC